MGHPATRGIFAAALILNQNPFFEIASNQQMVEMAKNAGVTTSKITFCDLLCEYSDFAKIDALDGSCRTFQSLWCKKLKRHVTKNAPCEATFGKRRPTTGF